MSDFAKLFEDFEDELRGISDAHGGKISVHRPEGAEVIQLPIGRIEPEQIEDPDDAAEIEASDDDDRGLDDDRIEYEIDIDEDDEEPTLH